MPVDNIFSYSSTPLPVKPNSRKKYREEDANLSLMSDPRVVRGMVSTTLKKAPDAEKGKTIKPPGTTKVTREITPASVEESTTRIQPTFFYDVSPLVQPDIDVSSFLVEDPRLSKPVSKIAHTQTDIFQERPDTPEYVPRKTGIDRSTQVDKVSDLFIFDEEVEPMLNVIVSKTLEQALFEIEREEELKNLEDEILRYHQERAVESQWAKRRVEESIADACIKDLALKGLKEKQKAERAVCTKVAARQAIKQVLPSIIDEATAELVSTGVWKNPQRVMISDKYLPSLYKAAAKRVNLHAQATDIIDGAFLCRYTVDI
jgi:radial spoke head protein 3